LLGCLILLGRLILLRRIGLILGLENALDPQKSYQQQDPRNDTENQTQYRPDKQSIAGLVEPTLVYSIEHRGLEQKDDDQIHDTRYHHIGSIRIGVEDH